MALLPVSALAETDKADGLRFSPEISWSEGDHRFALHFNSRLRWERWASLTNKSDNIYAARTRISGDYTWKSRLQLFAEGQYATVRDLDSGSVSQDTQKAEEPSPSDVSRLEDAIRRAMEWMATIDVHPIRLREEKGMKGIKHLVEYLDFHYLAYRASVDPQIKAASRKHAMDLLRVTEEGGYHNLASVDDGRFRQDSMSYLRACWLAEQFEFETTRYRREIEKVLPRIYRHLPTRGVDQRMGFALLFRQLGYSRPETQEQIYPESLIANHQPVSYYFRSPDRPYDLTHEVFNMTERGARPFPFPSPADERYAKGMVRRLLNHYVGQGNLDLTGEFLVNLVELGEARSAVAHEAREFIYRGQNRDGSFGTYEKEALAMRIRNPRYDVRIGGNLHTTMVCIWALVEMDARDRRSGRPSP